MLGGKLNEGDDPQKKLASRELAWEILLNQQETGKHHRYGQKFVPPPSMPSQTEKKANIKLITLAVGPTDSGIEWNNDPEALAANVRARLLSDGTDIPSDRIFGCEGVDLKIHKRQDYYKKCTGANKLIFESVWKSEKMSSIALRLREQYFRHNQTPATDRGDFVAVFCCKGGMHRSIAAAMGLHSWLRHEYEISNIDVELKHRQQDRLDRQSCRRQCEHCLETTNRFMWEVQLVTDALKGKGQYTLCRNPDESNAAQAQPGSRVL